MASFKRGDVRADGYVFHTYDRSGYARWYSPKSWFRQLVTSARKNARLRAEKKGVPFDVSLDHLISIFPEDGKCPILGTSLVWGGQDYDTSPALDRIVPSNGYVVGNVQWLSNKANNIKSNATTAEICAVADYLRENDYR